MPGIASESPPTRPVRTSPSGTSTRGLPAHRESPGTPPSCAAPRSPAGRCRSACRVVPCPGEWASSWNRRRSPRRNRCASCRVSAPSSLIRPRSATAVSRAAVECSRTPAAAASTRASPTMGARPSRLRSIRSASRKWPNAPMGGRNRRASFAKSARNAVRSLAPSDRVVDGGDVERPVARRPSKNVAASSSAGPVGSWIHPLNRPTHVSSGSFHLVAT